MNSRFVAACLQMRSVRDPQTNRDAIVALAKDAAERGAVYLQTPEMTNTVDRDHDTFRANVTDEAGDIVLAALRETAREKKVVIHIGSLAVKDGDRFANRAFLIGADGEIIALYTKIHLFDVDLPNGESWRESNSYNGGDKAVIAPLPWGLLGLTICYDVRFPVLYRSLAENGASLLSAPACFTRQTGEAHWQILQRARAIENGAFMISAAQGGRHEDGRETYGHSIIVDPWGRVLAEGGSEPGLVMAEIDMNLVAAVRQRIPSLKHTRPFTIETMT